MSATDAKQKRLSARQPSSLPQGWHRAPLSDVVGAPQYGLSLASTNDGNCPIIGMRDLVSGRVVNSGWPRVRVDEKEIANFRLNAGDLILNRTNSHELVGKLAIWDRNELAVFASYLVRFAARRDVAIPEYVVAALSEERAHQAIRRLVTTGVSQANINPSAFYEQIEINLPPLDEQRRISDALAVWDRAIQTAETLVAAKRRSYLAIRNSFLAPAFGGSSTAWKSFRMGDCFEERDETDPSLPLLSVTGDRGIIPRDEVERKDTSASDKGAYKVVRQQDIAYNTMRMWQGVFGVSAHTGIVSPAYTVVTARRKAIDIQFAAHLFRHRRAIHVFYQHSQGLVDDTLNLKFPHFSECQFNLPTLKRQKEIAEALTAAESEISPLESYLRALRIQKRGLMQKLLTGEWRLSDNAAEQAA